MWDFEFFPPPSPGEGPLTATKTSAPRRGWANRAALRFSTGFAPRSFPHPLKFIEICKFNGFPWNFQKFRQNFSKISKKSSKIMEKIATNVKKLTKKSQKFDEKMEIRKRCKGVHCVDLGESFPTHIYLQNLASIQPRTSLLKFEGGGFSAPVIFHTLLRVFSIP